MANNSGKKCFFITPIGEDTSVIRRNTDGLINIVSPILMDKYGFSEVVAAHTISTTGVITNQIVQHLLFDELVIANLTHANPNVMYELALRHISAKPVIHIAEKGTVLPFDLSTQRVIFFSNDIMGAKELIRDIERFVEADDFLLTFENPIYSSCKALKEYDGIEMDNVAKLFTFYPNEFKDAMVQQPKRKAGEEFGEKIRYLIHGRFTSHDEYFDDKFLWKELDRRLRYFASENRVNCEWSDAGAGSYRYYYVELTANRYLHSERDRLKPRLLNEVFQNIPGVEPKEITIEIMFDTKNG